MRKRIPRTVPALHHRLNLLRSPRFRAVRERSSRILEASRITVFTHKMGGLCMLVQSSERPRRTTKALVRAANTIVLAASNTKRPVNDARRSAPRPSPPPLPPHPQSVGGAGGPWIMSPCVSVPGILLIGSHYDSAWTDGGS